MTLNLLRSSASSPTISAWQHVHGIFDYNRHPLAPAGIKTLVHNDCNERDSFSVHGEESFYLGAELRGYRQHRVAVSATRRTRTSDTVSFHPVPKYQLLQTSPLTELLDSINLLTSQLKSFITSTAPSVQGLPDADTADVQSALRNLGSIFSNKPRQEPADRELSEPDCSIPQRVQVLSQAAEHPPTSIVAHKVSEVSSTETAISQRVQASQLNQLVPPNTILSGDLYQRKQKSPPLHT